MSKTETPSNTPPDTLADMIALYEEIARLTGRMLTAAQQHDWDQLNRLELGCASCIDRLAGCGSAPRVSHEIRQQKIALLHRILSNDRKTRELTEPWMRSIARLTGQESHCPLPGIAASD